MSRDGRWALAALLIAGFAAAAIVATYPHISQTWDEPAHLAAGLERLERGVYEYEKQHPPVSRVAIALLPYLDGLRGLGLPHIFDEGIALLERDERTLTLARFGILPFFVLLLAATWLWARHIVGPAPATVAVLLLATLPPLLGNAGIATTDVPSVATLTLTFLALSSWLDRPTWPRALLLAPAAGLALATKFSAVPFLALVLPTWIGVRWLVGGEARPAMPWRPGQYAAMLAILLLTLWTVYGLGVGPLLDPQSAPYEAIDQRLGTSGLARDLVYAIVQAPVYPGFLESMLRGIQSVAQHNAEGHTSYLLGEVGTHGWWYYYPVALAVRTPLPLLLLGLGGLGWMVMAGARGRDWRLLAPAAAAVVLLAFMCGFSNINIGLRHAMVLYPLLAIGGGCAAWRLARGGWPARIVVAALLGAQLGSAVLAHPDHLAYFNLLARGQPERILINADLDWGQDLKRLAGAVRERGIERIHVAYNGSADPARVVPGFEPLRPAQPTTGWIAISLLLTIDQTCGSYAWLEAYQPVAMVGSSIRLYRIDALKADAPVPAAPADLDNDRCRRLWRLPPAG